MSRAGVPLEWEAFVEHFAAGWAHPETEAFVAHFAPVFRDDARLIQPLNPVRTGPDALALVFGRFFRQLPGVRGEVVRWGACDDGVFIEIELSAHVGRREVRARAVDRLILDNEGRATERHTFMDPTPIIVAFLRSPSVWPRLARSYL